MPDEPTSIRAGRLRRALRLTVETLEDTLAELDSCQPDAAVPDDEAVAHARTLRAVSASLADVADKLYDVLATLRSPGHPASHGARSQPANDSPASRAWRDRLDRAVASARALLDA